MSFIQSKERELAKGVADKAMQMINSFHLIPTPPIFEVWFCYFARSHTEVVRSLDVFLDKKQDITDAICMDIYLRYLSDYRNEEKVRHAGEQIQDTLHDVVGLVDDVKLATADYNKTLEDVSSNITQAKTAEEVQRLVTKASSKTKGMLEQNRKLEEQLEKSKLLMDELKKDLETVRREAMTDGLTGLANRKAFDRELQDVMNEANQIGKVFTLLMVDIDHFKSFNDNFGHMVGDQVLRLVARTLKDGLKGRDVAARYGGEEFAIILPETELNAGMAVGNSLRKTIATKDVINRSTGEILGRITISVGVAEFIMSENIEDLIERADNALYTAKHNGRNQVAAAPSSTASASRVK